MSENSREALVKQFVELMDRMRVGMRSRSPVAWIEPELTMPQARTLFFLSQGPTRMGDISAYLDRGMPSATSMVDRLLKKGLVERIEDPQDRRVVVCRLTALGEEAVEKFAQIGHIRTEALADALTVDELEAVVPAIEILSAAISREANPSLPGSSRVPDGPQSGRAPAVISS